MERTPSRDKVTSVNAVEDVEASKNMTSQNQHVSGTVQLFQDDAVILIPTPSPDPKDPLNLPPWRKYVMIILVGLYSSIAVLGTSGLGAVFPEVLAMYPTEDSARATDLLTYPTLFMGIGNLISMPLSVAIGKRPLFLFSLVLLVASAIWCAVSTSLDSHIAGRDVFSIAAGQSEALAPMIVQEIHFLHEHGTKLAMFVGVQTAGTAVMFLATNYIVASLGLRWWYGIITIISGVLLIFSFIFVSESQFDRPSDAEEGHVRLKVDNEGNVSAEATGELLYQVTTRENRFLQPEKFGARTWKDDVRIFHFKPKFMATVAFYKETARAIVLPTIFWLLLLNGAFLGVYIYQASTFATILMKPPYLFHTQWLGFVQVVQVLDCVLMIPLLGYGSDLICKTLSRWRGGVFQPEYRLITLSLPVAAVIISCVIYGHAGASPNDWPWMAIVAPYHLGYFAFLGANLVGITYAVDSFPSQAGPMLLVICAGRGFISFGLSYSTVPLINLTGYDGGMNIYAIVCGVLSAIGIPAYLFGGGVRAWATKRFWPRQQGTEGQRDDH